MPTSAMLLGPALDRLGVGQRVGRVGVAGAGGGQHVLLGPGHLGHRLPGRAVALEARHQRGVDHVVLEGPDQEGGDQAAVLPGALHRRIGGPGQDGAPRDAGHLVVGPGPAEEVGLDFGLPGAEARTGPGAQRAALQAVGAVVGPPVGGDVEGPVDPVLVVVAEDVVRADDHAGGAPRAQSGRHDLGEQLGPLRLLGRHWSTIFGLGRTGRIPCAGARDPRSRAVPRPAPSRRSAGRSPRPGWSTPATAAVAPRRLASDRPWWGTSSPPPGAGESCCCSTPTGGRRSASASA